MIHLERVITVPTDIQAAFDYVADFTTTAEWDPGIERARQVTGDGPGLGSRYEVVSNFGERELDLTYVNEGFDRPNRLVFRGGDKRFESVDVITFEASDVGTQVTYTADFRMKGVLALIEPFLRSRFNDVVDDGAAGLEARLRDL
jgi:hypothetical protein